MTQHGGKRLGAGRPAARGERKQTTSVRLSPTVLAFIAACDDSAGNVIEDTIRRSAAFKRWLKDAS